MVAGWLGRDPLTRYTGCQKLAPRGREGGGRVACVATVMYPTEFRSDSLKFLRQLFSKPEPPQTLTRRLSGPGTFAIEATELSLKYLDAFWKANSNEWQRKSGESDFYERQTDATLVSDTENRFPHAISVEIGGRVVGHLRHPDALRLHRRLKDLGYEKIRAKCDANLVGRTGHWEVSLDLDAALPGCSAASSDREN